MSELAKTVETLCNASRAHDLRPWEAVVWPSELDPKSWQFSPELISLFGTPLWDALDEPTRKRLSFFEAVQFFSLNIHGERALVAGLSTRLYSRRHSEVTPYLHHFLEEENRHMTYFGGYCTRYAGKIYPDRKLVLPREYAPGEEDFLFFARILIFEEVVDVYNRLMSADERLDPLARRINDIHHREELRHLAFGRQFVAQLWGGQKWPQEVVAGVRDGLAQYFAATWREYVNPDVYRDAGLADPFAAREAVLAAEPWREHCRETSRGVIEFFVKHGIFETEPAL